MNNYKRMIFQEDKPYSSDKLGEYVPIVPDETYSFYCNYKITKMSGARVIEIFKNTCDSMPVETRPIQNVCYQEDKGYFWIIAKVSSLQKILFNFLKADVFCNFQPNFQVALEPYGVIP